MKYIKTYEEIKTINYILNINESNQINEGIIDRVKKMATKGLLTATVMASLMTNPTFAKEFKSLPSSEKTGIENLIKSPSTETVKDSSLVATFGKEVDITKSFKSGGYQLDVDGKDDLNKKLTELADYMSKAGYDSYDFDISASESLVPNKKNSGLKHLELAQKRANEVKELVKEFLKNNKTPGVNICIDVTEGGPKWNGEEDVNQQKFTEHQYVKIKVIPLSSNPDDFCGFSYSPGSKIPSSNKTFEKEWNVTDKYGSGDIILTPGPIPDRILMYADGQLIGDSGFFADGEHAVTKKLGFDYVPKTVYELTNLYNAKDPSVADTQFSKLKVVRVNSVDELIHLLNPSNPTSWDYNNPDIAPLDDLIKMFNNKKYPQRDFVIYEKVSSKISFDLKAMYKKIKLVVYSNVKKSKFGIKVKCSK